MDIASLVGLILGAVMVVFGILSSGGNIVDDFMDFPSVIITIGGSLAGTLASHKLADFISGLKSIGLAMKEPSVGDASEVQYSLGR